MNGSCCPTRLGFLRGRDLLVAASLFMATGCQSHAEKLAAFRAHWDAGLYGAAETELDNVLASESSVEREEITASRGTSAELDLTEDDVAALLLEKAMLRLIARDPSATVAILRRCRDELDRHFEADLKNFLSSSGSILTDDTAIPFAGADYENILVRAVLCLADLMVRGDDAYAYALQVGEKQEQILGSPLGEELGSNPRSHYQRVAIGAYLQGVIREDALDATDAALAYGRAVDYGGSAPIFAEAKARAEAGRLCEPGNGIVHVFYLGGRGPWLTEAVAPTTSDAMQIANFGAALVTENLGALAQAPVPVPRVQVRDGGVAPLAIVPDAGGTTFTTQTVLDVNQVASQQLSALEPWIIARAVIRRAVKQAAALAAGAAARQANRSDYDELIGCLVTGVVNATLTASESADTRNWSTLPAQFQAARFELQAGDHALSFSDGSDARLRVSAGRNTYVLVYRPDLSRPGIALVDGRSQLGGSTSRP